MLRFFRSQVQGQAAAWTVGLVVGAGVLWACGDPPTEEPTSIVPPGGGDNGGEETQVDGSFTYTFSEETSLIYTKVFAKAGTSGHDHVIRAAGFTGSLRYDSGDASTCEVSIELDVNSMGVDEDAMREFLGWETLNSTSKNSVRSNMLDEDQLYASAHPKMNYVATSCETTASGIRILGDMTIRGVTQSLPIEGTLTTTTTGLESEAVVEFNQSSFGYTPYKLFGYENADTVEMTLLIVANRDE